VASLSDSGRSVHGPPRRGVGEGTEYPLLLPLRGEEWCGGKERFGLPGEGAPKLNCIFCVVDKFSRLLLSDLGGGNDCKLNLITILDSPLPLMFVDNFSPLPSLQVRVGH